MLVEEVWSYLQSSLLGRIIFFGVSLFAVLAVLLGYYQNNLLYMPSNDDFTEILKVWPRALVTIPGDTEALEKGI